MKKLELAKIVKEEFNALMHGREEEDGAEFEGADDSEIKTDLETIAQQALNASKHANGEEPEAWVKSHILAAKELLNHVEEFYSEGQPDSTDHSEEDVDVEKEREDEEPVMKEYYGGGGDVPDWKVIDANTGKVLTVVEAPSMEIAQNKARKFGANIKVVPAQLKEDNVDADVAKKEVDFLTAKDKQIQTQIKKKKMGATTPMAESEEYTDENGDTWNDEGETVASKGRQSIKGRTTRNGGGYKDTFNQRGKKGGENLDWARQGLEDMDETGVSRIYQLEQQIRNSGEYIKLRREGWSSVDAMDMLMAKYGGSDYYDPNNDELAAEKELSGNGGREMNEAYWEYNEEDGKWYGEDGEVSDEDPNIRRGGIGRRDSFGHRNRRKTPYGQQENPYDMETGYDIDEETDNSKCPECGEGRCQCPEPKGGYNPGSEHVKSPMQKTQKSVPVGVGSKKKVTIREANELREIAKKMKDKGEHGKLKDMIDRLEGKKVKEGTEITPKERTDRMDADDEKYSGKSDYDTDSDETVDEISWNGIKRGAKIGALGVGLALGGMNQAWAGDRPQPAVPHAPAQIHAPAQVNTPTSVNTAKTVKNGIDKLVPAGGGKYTMTVPINRQSGLQGSIDRASASAVGLQRTNVVDNKDGTATITFAQLRESIKKNKKA